MCILVSPSQYTLLRNTIHNTLYVSSINLYWVEMFFLLCWQCNKFEGVEDILSKKVFKGYMEVILWLSIWIISLRSKEKKPEWGKCVCLAKEQGHICKKMGIACLARWLHFFSVFWLDCEVVLHLSNISTVTEWSCQVRVFCGLVFCPTNRHGGQASKAIEALATPPEAFLIMQGQSWMSNSGFHLLSKLSVSVL